MLLYTRLAQPKAPKRRSRAEDTYEWEEQAVSPCESAYFSPLESKLNIPPLPHIVTDAADEIHSPPYGSDNEDSHSPSQQLVRRTSYDGAKALTPTRSSLRPELAMIAPCPARSPSLEFYIPAFSEFSDRPNRRALVDHFCNVLSHLIVFREESGNPFQQLVLPLSYSSLPVMNAIYALAGAHLENRGVQNPEESLYFHNEAIQGLSRIIESRVKVDKNELLAAIMLLVYYEVLVQRRRTNIINGHLKGAFAIMCLNQELLTPVGLFLERAFGFYDVITALSLGTPPLSTAPSAGGLLPVPPLDAPAASPLTNVDTLLGMATTLWPIMHRLSNLLFTKKELEDAQRMNQVSKVAVLRTEFETTSQAIETALAQWKPCLPPNIAMRDDVLVLHGVEGEEIPEMARLQSILHNALAYRHSAFVYLYRTIYGAEDRELARKAFGEIEERQGMTNIEEAWGIIQEVWKRLDLLDDDDDDDAGAGTDPDLWRKICAERGVTIVFG
ncbi:hypothetical protein NPX13_g9487 [Xylaria arbuscula]|uniref:Uncharacterized protein n=1 Tax=Xylaria arbuscula TaxID=114810 RepID=A0A9W8N6L8_9PEZI|nr:hypothetical protein NPX13_g9487 [Xylaria arbuscula]